MKTLKTCLTIISVIFLISCTSARVHNIEGGALPTTMQGYPYQLHKVRSAIIRACQTRGWNPSIQRDGSIIASIDVRGHYAKVRITYNRRSVNIRYMDSRNLKYANGKIHRNYNRWIDKLYHTINDQLAR
ncbi:hypothetical protein [Zooshikella sp. RANM57]|uniref:hypothetical protein n=1 Tax=Zooshikella sp. RANM57 TaxID=3425863 RepID=UPI003D6E8CBF